ncbi:DotI/IcmL family type IV secretion protein (plasmid) [Shewanella xiamenensis]|uniref:DotI/IcmL family type IV secretion protein n=1 Tax=Shewanella xiamenensis TaxID=332186 RepID=A0ABT6UIG0_9GAMM|nr:DotI/IcmL/TraM family protein [Shewanella xiamenensis]MDI5833306.1 DotI/IcmL family type IV secretion protein [Shewanella xiamenensis]WHF57944.1 DotI/IcmL family type IV secretion protein [Shewanella xiamenensis]
MDSSSQAPVQPVNSSAREGIKKSNQAQHEAANPSATKSEEQTEMSMFASQLLVLRGVFDRETFLKKLILGSLILNIILAFAVGMLLMTNDVIYKYFTVDQQGRIVPVVAMDEPVLTEGALREWAADCVRSSYTFMFANYKDALGSSLGRCFTKDGSVKFKEQLANSGIVKQIVEGQGALVTQIDGIVNIRKEGIVDGAKAYVIEIPVKIQKIFPKEAPIVKDWTVIITAFRVDNIEYEKGTAIHVWGMEPRR